MAKIAVVLLVATVLGGSGAVHAENTINLGIAPVTASAGIAQ